MDYLQNAHILSENYSWIPFAFGYMAFFYIEYLDYKRKFFSKILIVSFLYFVLIYLVIAHDCMCYISTEMYLNHLMSDDILLLLIILVVAALGTIFRNISSTIKSFKFPK